jgi:hypothetical protein
MARIVVCGYMVRHPVAGNLLAYFHYVLGLHRLGHEVVYLEESGWPNSCYDPWRCDCGDDPQAGLRAVRAAMSQCGVKIPVCYVHRGSGRVEGADWRQVKKFLQAADLLLNIGGVCWLPEFSLCRRRALIDMDPLFTQLGRFGAEGIEEYQTCFSYGANIGRPGCTIPSKGIDWLPTVPPVVEAMWQAPSASRAREGEAAAPEDRPLTTVTNWSAYRGATYQGEYYGQKDQEFLALTELPLRTSQSLELAVAGAGPQVWEQLRRGGWSVRDAGEVSSDLPTYLGYICGSRGEFSAAKHAYVKTHSGWFSDRSVCYLAAGLPVVLQDTGFSDWLPAGCGVLAFSTIEEAAERIEALNAGYTLHCRAAAEIAANTFSYKVVLPRLIQLALHPRAAVTV